MAEQVGCEVEEWLAAEQERILQAVGTPAPAPAIHAKFYISFDGTGVPVRKSELVGRRGRHQDGSARTREAKLGCVFTQVGLDREGYPQRDSNSTTYVGAIECSELFGWRLYAEALRRGLERAKTVVVLTDGARYNHTIVQTHFPRAVHIVDLFHAYEHLTAIAQILWGQGAKAPKPGEIGWKRATSTNSFAKPVNTCPPPLKAKKRCSSNCATLRKMRRRCAMPNIARRNSLWARVWSRPAAARSSESLKQSGMRWSVRGANAILALRCCILSDRFEDFWASRTP